MDKNQIKAAIQALAALAEAIRELKRVPAGTLYAHLMGVMSLESFEAAIDRLVKSGLVRREASHELVWTGPREVDE
jgi:hypothetical protein